LSSRTEQSAGAPQVAPSDGPAGVSAVVESSVSALPVTRDAPGQTTSTGEEGTRRKEGSGEALSHPLVQDLMLNPARWRIWPAVAVIRWLQRRIGRQGARLVYRFQPSLGFASSEISEFAIREGRIELTLNAGGMATAGSALPASDIARIIADERRGGALGAWLDGPGDLFMQVLEAALAARNAPFSLLTGGRVDAHQLVADVVGRSAPLVAGRAGVLHDARRREPRGSIGLAGLFVGPISALGLANLFRAFTSLPVRVEEFTGADVFTARPARVGYPLGTLLGTVCRLPSAGVEIHIEGGSDPDTQKWARDPTRRQSLHFLALSYVGAPSPVVRLFLWLDPGNAPPAALADGSAFGGMAVLGEAPDRVRLPLET
jgi:predicted component of type VI protein secretion system